MYNFTLKTQVSASEDGLHNIVVFIENQPTKQKHIKCNSDPCCSRVNCTLLFLLLRNWLSHLHYVLSNNTHMPMGLGYQGDVIIVTVIQQKCRESS